MNTLEISKQLFNRYESVHTVQAYPGLMAYYALSCMAVSAKDDALLQKCMEYLGKYPDAVEHPKYNFESYRIGGNGKAYLMSHGYFPEQKELLREYAEATMSAPTDRNGLMCMPSCPEKEQVWIDIVMAVTPFMLYAGRTLGEEKYIDFACRQCFGMYELFLDKTCGLLHQARGFMDDLSRVTSDHWGRGNGWCFVGLAALVEDLPKDSPHRKKAERYFKDLVTATLPYQNVRGVWRQELASEASWDESSGSALIAYAIGVGLRLGILKKDVFLVPYQKALEGIKKQFIRDDFTTDMCCVGCLAPGEGAEKGTVNAYLTAVYPKNDEPHSFGPLMFCYLEAYRNGIYEIGG